jgi:uncharacterized membrane protein YphA (DoxX/SURF4 family)|tara:strand:- start:5383 stop:6516 length:1134 start_codon:yes stop_codon:yes gene_type:complete
MKNIYTLSRYLVGILFIFSGLIKINDPVGTQIKLEEYFQVFSSDFTPLFEHLVPLALFLSVILCTLEVVIGIALILNYRMKITSSILLTLILFFTFLTFYSAYFNKVTDCGCFGDAIKLTPWESFTKDIILLFFSFIIFFLTKKFKKEKGFFYIKILDYKNSSIRDGIIVFTTLICLIISVTAINFLPFIDFRAYKVGNDIVSLMEPSEDLKYSYIMEKNEKEYVFDIYPNDESYTFKELRLLNPEAEAKITDYSLWNNNEDYTKESLSGNKLFIIIHNINNIDKELINKIKKLTSNIYFWVEPVIVTSNEPKSFNQFLKKNAIKLKYVYGDATVLKTIIRSNPGFFLLRNGFVKGKWHYNNIPDPKEVLKKVGINP